MEKELNLSEKEKIILKRVGIEFSHGFMHVENIGESFLIKDILQVYITRPKEDKVIALKK